MIHLETLMMRSFLMIVLGIGAVAMYPATASAAPLELLENNDMELESRFAPHGTPGVDHPNGYADYWHHSTEASWSDPSTDPFVSATHSLKIPDDNAGGLVEIREEMRSFATGIPGVGNAGRSLDVSWNWDYDITSAPGDKFSIFIRISDAPQVSLDLVGNIVDHVVLTTNASSGGFVSESINIPLSPTDASFDIIFRTSEGQGGALPEPETGVMFVDDVSVNLIPEPSSLLLLSIAGLMGLMVMGRRQRG